MMKIFVTNNIVLFILVVTTTIDASRILYLPLPKIHPSHQQAESAAATPEPNKIARSDEFIPASVIEQEEIEKRGDTFDWEDFIDQAAAATKRRIAVNEISPEKSNPLREQHPIIEPHENSRDEISEKQSVDTASKLKYQSYLDEPWVVDSATVRIARLQSNAALNSIQFGKRRNDVLFVAIVGICCFVGFVGLVAAAIFWYKVQKRAEAAADSEYPSYGVTGPASGSKKVSPSSSMSDRKLAQSAQMFHYQQQRQQMMAQEKAHLDAKPVHSDDSDDEAPAGGDYTVYECPGLAPTGEMEVRNPLFAEPDSSLISPTSSLHSTINNPSLQSSSPPKEKLSP